MERDMATFQLDDVMKDLGLLPSPLPEDDSDPRPSTSEDDSDPPPYLRHNGGPRAGTTQYRPSPPLYLRNLHPRRQEAMSCPWVQEIRKCTLF